MIRIPQDPVTRRSYLTTAIVMGSVTAVVRMICVALWSVVGEKAIVDSMWIEIGLSVLSDLIIASIVAATIILYSKRATGTISFEVIGSSIAIYVVSTLALLLLAGIIPHDVDGGRAENVISVVSTHIVALGVYLLSIGLAGFLSMLALHRRARRGGMRLVLVGVLLFIIWLFSVLDVLAGTFRVLAIVLGFIAAISVMFIIGKLHWLQSISIDRKIRLLWLSMCGAFASAVLGFLLVFDSDSFVTVAAQNFLRSGSVVPATINLIGFVFFVRLFFGTLVSLPNSSIVDRRSSEVNSLATLTKLVAESASVDQLVSSVTKYASGVCGAHGAWCELYEDGEINISGAELVHPEYVRSLHNNRHFNRLFTSNDKPVLIESLKDINADVAEIAAMRSIIAVPLIAHHMRVGTLVMFSTVEYGFDQDDLRLLTAFADTVGVALDQARLMEASIEHERMQKEFEVARKIQASLLPRSSPKTDCCNIDAITIPAAQVGGDYFDYVRFKSGRLGAIIADVSGKGVPAALYMATLKGAVLAEMRSADGPADLLRRINTTLWGSMGRNTYISMMCVEFDKDSMILRIARAGHTPAILRLGGKVTTIAPRGIAIGVVKPEQFDSAIEEVEIKVQSDDICLLTTDGVNERRNEELTEMTFDPVIEMIASYKERESSELIRSTLHLLEDHGKGTDQHDDITIVAIVFTDDETSSEKERKQKTAGELA